MPNPCSKLTSEAVVIALSLTSLYREINLLVNLGWVDTHLSCSTPCPIQLGQVEMWQKCLGS